MIQSLFSQNTIINEVLVNHTINVFVNSLITLVILIFCFIFIMSFENIKIINKKQRNINLFYFFAGILVSSISFLYVYLEAIDLNVLIFIFSLSTLTYFLKRYFMYGTLPLMILTIIFSFFKYEQAHNHLARYFLLMYLLYYFFTFTLIHFIDLIKWKNILIFIFYQTLILVASSIITLPIIFTQTFAIINLDEKVSMIIYIAFFVLCNSLLYSVFNLYLRFRKKINLIDENIRLKNGFIMEKYAADEINNYLLDNDVSCASIFKFDVIGLEQYINKYGISHVNKIKNNVLSLISKRMENTLFFSLGDNNNFFGLTKITKKIDINNLINGNDLNERTTDDIFSNIEKVIKQIEKEFNKQNNTKISVKCAATIYGVISSDINQLTKTLESHQWLPSYENKNNIQFLHEIINVQTLGFNVSDILKRFKVFSPNEIRVKLQEKRVKKEKWLQIEASSLSPLCSNKKEIVNKSDDNIVKQSLIRHISMKAIKAFNESRNNYKNSVLLIDYPIEELEDNFVVPSLLASLAGLNLTRKNFIINIVLQNNEENKNIDIAKSINDLVKNKVRFTFDLWTTGIDTEYVRHLTKLKPEKIFLDNL